jgi:3-phenylpropionate/trans-cinnamate dioxygenase ferredoxin subunit
MELPGYIKIADSMDEIPFGTNQLTEITVEGKKICLARWQDQVFACTPKCPHAGGILANGFLDAAGKIVCPLHRYKFDLQNGRNLSGEGYYLKTFQIVVNENGVFMEKQKKKGFLSFLD